MKKVWLLSILLLCSVAGQAQIQIASGIDWKMGLSPDGPFNLIPYNVSACVDEVYIDSICGTWYDSPMLDEHFADCPEMTPIWGAPAAPGCYFDPFDSYWFRKSFFLDLNDCNTLDVAFANIQADQRFTLYINGLQVGYSTDSDWDQLFSYDVTNQLLPGQNEVLVQVANIGGGSCFNYAFLAFCLDIYTLNSFDHTANFSTDLLENNNDYSVVNAAVDQSTGLDHNWMVLWGDTPGQQNNFYGFWGPGTGAVLNFDPVEDFDSCRYFQIIHRVFIPGEDCESCEARIVQICLDDNQAPLEQDRAEIDCDIFRQYVGTEDNGLQTGEVFVQLFPNPASERVTMWWKGIQPTTIRLHDARGQLLDTQKTTPSVNQTEWNTGDLPPGIYLLELLDEARGQRVTQSFVIGR